jgi:general stress protein YciG
MNPEQQRRIAREGGKASHASGRGHRFTPEEARIAGRKGGQVRRPSV